jgi:6-phospho-beta-glucosidase
LDIDTDSAAEMSCVITKEGPMPLNIGRLPVQIVGLIAQIKSFERLCVQAAVEGDRDKAILALTINPLTPSDAVANDVVTEMLEAHKKYLPRFFTTNN